MSKSRTARKPRRKIEIYFGDLLVATRWASSLSQALREFVRDRGLKDCSVSGNVLVVRVGEERHVFTAKDRHKP